MAAVRSLKCLELNSIVMDKRRHETQSHQRDDRAVAGRRSAMGACGEACALRVSPGPRAVAAPDGAAALIASARSVAVRAN
jgi:hypothetical protein